jgi:hypothetical protein
MVFALTKNMDNDTGEQDKNSREWLKPWQYKKGQSGNPSGRTKGTSLKEYVKMKFSAMTDDEKEEFLHGLDKETIWKQGEGNPESNDKLKVNETIVDSKDIKALNDSIKQLIKSRNKS